MTHADEFEKIFREVDTAIEEVGEKKFSNEGFKEYKCSVGIYIYSLFIESIKIAKRNNADSISAVHVYDASKYLAIRAGRNSLVKIFEILGGVLLGATLSNLFAMTVLGQEYSLWGMVFNIVAGIVGGLLIGINVIKE